MASEPLQNKQEQAESDLSEKTEYQVIVSLEVVKVNDYTQN